MTCLHEGWEEVTVHRDVKCNNVLLNANMNGKVNCQCIGIYDSFSSWWIKYYLSYYMYVYLVYMIACIYAYF